MKKLAYLFLLSFFFIIACEPPIVFTEPQPKKVKAETAFSEEYQGVYFCESDTSLVKVTEKGIYKEKDFYFTTTPEDISEMDDMYLENDELIINWYFKPLKITYLDDEHLSGVLTIRDTLFWISNNHVLKYYKGHQILNYNLGNRKWDIYVFSQDDYGNVSYMRTKLPENLEELEKITPVTNLSDKDKTQYQVSPTKMEFKKLLETQIIFEECDYFNRIGRKLEDDFG